MNASSWPLASGMYPFFHMGANHVFKCAATIHKFLGQRLDALIFLVKSDQAVVGVIQGKSFLHALDGATKTFVALARRFFRLLALGDVGGAAAITLEGSGIVEDGRSADV